MWHHGTLSLSWNSACLRCGLALRNYLFSHHLFSYCCLQWLKRQQVIYSASKHASSGTSAEQAEKSTAQTIRSCLLWCLTSQPASTITQVSNSKGEHTLYYKISRGFCSTKHEKMVPKLLLWETLTERSKHGGYNAAFKAHCKRRSYSNYFAFSSF